MRWIIRFLLVWIILGTAGYFIGLPQAAKYLLKKTQDETLSQCQQQLQAQHLYGTPGAPLSPEKASSYCHCLADPLTLDRSDIFDMLQQYRVTHTRLPPARLTAQIKTQVDTCNPQLQHDITGQQQPSAPRLGLPAEKNATTTYIIH